MARSFRTERSVSAERATRDAVAPLLRRHGFDVLSEERTERGIAVTQVVVASQGDMPPVRIHVRLCWRRDGRNPREALYSAAQLRARLIDDDWEATLAAIAAREARDGNSHMLLVQDSEDGIVLAALLPCSEIPAIWRRQREVSDELIAAGLTGNMRKNHAANGASPTIWLQDDRTPANHEVPDVLWTWPGVVNVMSLSGSDASSGLDDSWADLAVEEEPLGRDQGNRATIVRSGYPRDAKVRSAVLQRGRGQCERRGCGARRPYSGFLDVHHILGIGMSDRVWSCVTLCPNCHREAHFAPDRAAINAALRDYAVRFAEPADMSADLRT